MVPMPTPDSVRVVGDFFPKPSPPVHPLQSGPPPLIISPSHRAKKGQEKIGEVLA